eukprot:TRINITY_DN1333_c0_g1_i1.p1 TRINITY_DN1333_c0_g1~~TRINITY_DN1333_c0_g1_i1.p1  ORF type:complete len:53 (-),score=5.44 TRINITY_DN1333_c0_g1_i1:1-159(-)
MSAGSASAVSPSGSSQKMINYCAEKVIGNGSFGVVFLAKVQETNEIVARHAS